MVAQVDLQTVMGEVRERTFALVAHLDEEQLNRPFDPIMSPLAWDLGHMAAYEDLWLNQRVAGRQRPGRLGWFRTVLDRIGRKTRPVWSVKWRYIR